MTSKELPERLQRLLDEGPIDEKALREEAEHIPDRVARFRAAWRAERAAEAEKFNQASPPSDSNAADVVPSEKVVTRQFSAVPKPIPRPEPELWERDDFIPPPDGDEQDPSRKRR